MVWTKLDDQYPRHKKLLAAGAEGLALDVAAICWSNAEGTDGFIPDYALTVLYPVRNHAKVAARLVEVNRWERDNQRGGWHIHDFHDFNPTADEAADVKAKRAEAGRRGGQASATAKRRATAGANGQASASANGKQKSNPVSRNPLGVPSEHCAFDDFWDAYPNHDAKAAARKAWAARVKAGVDPAELIHAAKNYSLVKHGTEKRYLMHAATFCGPNERWKDFLDTPGLRVVGGEVYDERPERYA